MIRNHLSAMRYVFLRFILIFFPVFYASSLKSQNEADSLKLLLNKNSADSYKVKIAFQISRTYWHSNTDSVLFYAQKGFKIAQSIHFRKGEADCLNSLSAVYWIQRNYPMALDYTLRNLEIRQEIGDKTGIFNASNNLGLIYHETKRYDLALHYSKEAFSIAEEMNDKKKIAKSSLNMGIIYYQLKDTAAAYLNYRRALENQLVLKDTIELSYIYYNLGELFLETDYKRSVLYHKTALSLAERKDNKEIISACLQVLADERRKAGKLDESVTLGRKALAIASQMQNLKVMDLAAQSLYKTFLQKKDYKNSLEYYIIADNAQDSMLNEKAIAAMSDLKYSFELKQKMKQIEILEKTREIGEKNAQNQTLKFYLGTFIIVVVGLIAFLVYRHYRIQQQKMERAKYEKMLNPDYAIANN